MYTPATVIYTLSLHDALPIYTGDTHVEVVRQTRLDRTVQMNAVDGRQCRPQAIAQLPQMSRIGIQGLPAELCRLAEDRKSTRLNSSHPSTSYAGCCLKTTIPS